MKVLLVFPRFEPNANPPLGIAYIAGCLRSEGIGVEILDPTFEDWNHAVERIKKADYGIIGFSCFTMSYNIAKKLAAIAKESNSSVLTVFGGPHPTTHPDETIVDKEVDVVCLNEGEETFVELVQALESNKSLKGVKGIWFKQGKTIMKNPEREMLCNLDELPLPARDLLPMDRYLRAELGTGAWAVKQPSTTVMVGRGCPYNCTYCTTKLMFGKKVRLRSADSVVAEIQHLLKAYGIKGIAFIDDTFTIRRPLVEEICDKLIEKKIDIDWACHTRIDALSKEILKKMRKSGCTYITLGIESGNQDVLDKFMKKGIKLENAEKVFKWAKEAGITTGAYFILGIPGETKENMQETIDFAIKLNPDVVNFIVARPLPKTEMYEMAKKFGKLNVEGWDDFNFDAKPIFEGNEWSSEYVEKMCKKAYNDFYFRPSYLLKQLFSVRHTKDIKKVYRGLLMILKRTFLKKEAVKCQ